MGGRACTVWAASAKHCRLTFFQQMLVLGTDPVFGVVESTSTNALQLTVGWF